MRVCSRQRPLRSPEGLLGWRLKFAIIEQVIRRHRHLRAAVVRGQSAAVRAVVVYFAWGQIFALFPATCTDIYGKKFAATNCSMLYTAKGTAALLVPLANVLTTATGGWTVVFMVASALNIFAAVLAFAALKPMRMRAILNENSASPEAASLLPPRA